MTDKRKNQTQQTVAPKEKDRIEIPIPKRRDVLRALKAAAQPSGPRRPKKKRFE
jgi:hypothetical protein